MPRRLVHGFGINDADYVVNPTVNGRIVRCPYYDRWQSMLGRCTKHSWHRHPTYVGCRVCSSWLRFSRFKDWMLKQPWESKFIDKDLLGNGKLYSPKTCIFVCRAVNNFMNDHRSVRGLWPTGVDKPCKYFRARVNKAGKLTHLGYFDTPEEAHQAWRKAKLKLTKELIKIQTDPRVKKGLRLYAKKLQAA